MEKGRVRLSVPKIQSDSVVDGEGIRSVIWFQGCSHNCPGCHNPETHDFKAGYEFDIDEVKGWIKELDFQQGVTFSGGDPMMQVDSLIELAKVVHECNMNVWVYTGFTYEELIKMSESNPKYIDALNEIDILVDGKFVLEKKSFDVAFRGSSNQRIIDVKKSIEKGKVVLVEKYI
jgi:anaerobic ribonucleoside-triphosphate reductase activating protein